MVGKRLTIEELGNLIEKYVDFRTDEFDAGTPDNLQAAAKLTVLYVLLDFKNYITAPPKPTEGVDDE